MVEAAGIQFAAFNDADARSPREIIEHLQGADGAITSYGSFTAEVFEALPHLRVVSKTGTGVDNIDVAAATTEPHLGVQRARLRHRSGVRPRLGAGAVRAAAHQRD